MAGEREQRTQAARIVFLIGSDQRPKRHVQPSPGAAVAQRQCHKAAAGTIATPSGHFAMIVR
jgi:hypothetical protein